MSARPRTLPRRTRPPLWMRIRAWWLIGVVIVGIAACGLFGLANVPQFALRVVDVTLPADGVVAKADVLNAAAIPLGSNVWLLDTHAIARRIEALPYVASVTVHRRQFPVPSIALDVHERAAFACVFAGAVAMTIDEHKRVLQAGCASPALPRIEVGEAPLPDPGNDVAIPEVNQLVSAQRLVAASLPVRLLRRDRFGGLEVVDRAGVTLKLGNDADLPAKLALIGPIRKALPASRRVRSIDLRAADTPVVEFY